MNQQSTLSALHPLSPPMMFFEMMGGFAIDAGISEKWLGEDWLLGGALTTLAGAAGIAYTAWCWLGRSEKARSWASAQHGPDLAILAIPFFAFAIFGLGVDQFFGAPRVVTIIFGAISGIFAIVGVLGFFDCPKWWGPRWFRRGEFERTRSS